MSTKRGRIQESIKKFVKQKLIFGDGYVIRRDALIGELERFVDNDAFVTTHNSISTSSEFYRLYPMLRSRVISNNTNLCGIAYKEDEGKSINHFINQYIIIDHDARVSNEKLNEIFDLFLDGNETQRRSMNDVFKELVLRDRNIMRTAFKEDGKYKRGIKGISLK